MQDRNRILLAMILALAAGAIAYANPTKSLQDHFAKKEAAAKKRVHAFLAECPFDWDQAPVARAMLSITQ